MLVLKLISPLCRIYAAVNRVSIGSDNGLSPIRRQAIIWTNAGILSIGPLWTNFSEIRIEIHNFSFMRMHLKISSVKWRPFCPGEDELIPTWRCPSLALPIKIAYSLGVTKINTGQTLNSQMTPHSSPSQASNMVFIVLISETNKRPFYSWTLLYHRH